MKKYDIFFMGIVLAIASSIALWYGSLAVQEGGQICVTVDREVYGTYFLDKEQEIRINDTNILMIQNQEAYMKEATCPNQDCVHQKKISKRGETITCLPNKIIVEVIQGETPEIDGVSN